MALATEQTKMDGILYEKGAELPDLGSFICVKEENKRKTYWGLSKDITKLPKYVVTGSCALCLDTSDQYYFFAPTQTWYKVNNLSPVFQV